MIYYLLRGQREAMRLGTILTGLVADYPNILPTESIQYVLGLLQEVTGLQLGSPLVAQGVNLVLA